MTSKDKGTIVGWLFVFGCVVYSSGLSAGWNFIKQIGVAVESAIQYLVTIAMQFRDELGITDWLWTRGIFAVIATSAWLLAGHVFSRKEEKKLLGIISTIVGLISIMLTTV